jgi:hypothetical protein
MFVYCSSVGIVTGYGLDSQGFEVKFPAGAGDFSLLHIVQSVSGFYPMATRGSFPRGKLAGS